MLHSLKRLMLRSLNDRPVEIFVRQCVTKHICQLSAFQNRLYSNKHTSVLKNEKSALYRSLFAKIMACGPITVAEYMKEVLTSPSAGYYMNKDVFGTKGDFITSSEISQLFGEMVAIWIINEWQKISGESIQLVELGPGRGTLSNDMLRVFNQLRLTDKVSLHLVEVSPTLSSIQAKHLCTSSEEKDLEVNENRKNSISYYRQGVTKDGVNVFWYYSVNDVPRKFSIFIAYEFFDALPIHKFQKTSDGWSEILVDIDPTSDGQEKFRFVLTRTDTPARKLYVSDDEKRDHVEISPQTLVIVDYISTFIKECGGFALIGDYGHCGEKTDTFRSFHKHKLHDPLLNPGTADLTADVDFSLIKEIARRDNRLITFGPVSQKDFLKQLGIDVRLHILLQNANEDEKDQIVSGYHMITDDDKMGNCFKLLSLYPSVLKEHLQKWPVAGFQDITTQKRE